MDSDVIVLRTNESQFEPDFPDGIAFEVVATACDAVRIAPAHAAVHGWPAAIKMIAKCATPRRSYWVARRGREILSDGWMQKGRYRNHSIGPEDWVLESIATIPSARGMSLSYLCLVRAINLCLRQGAVWVYGDSTKANAASWKVCMKSGLRPL